MIAFLHFIVLSFHPSSKTNLTDWKFDILVQNMVQNMPIHRGTDMPSMDTYTKEFSKIGTGEVIWWHQRCIVCKKLCRKKVH
jgi:hypothetical protein